MLPASVQSASLAGKPGCPVGASKPAVHTGRQRTGSCILELLLAPQVLNAYVDSLSRGQRPAPAQVRDWARCPQGPGALQVDSSGHQQFFFSPNWSGGREHCGCMSEVERKLP